MDILQLVFEAFANAPIFFIVPLLLVAFVIWSPWSPARFYVHHDHEHLEGPHAAVAETARPEPL